MSAIQGKEDAEHRASVAALSAAAQFPPITPGSLAPRRTAATQPWKTVSYKLLYLGGSVACGLVLYCALFLTPLFAGQTILFYRGIELGFVAAACLAGASAALARWLWRSLDWTLILAATCMSLAFNLCFLTVIPVTLDRSISVFLLARMEAAGPRGLSQAEARKLFIDDYVVGMDQIGRRYDEQLKSGNIELRGDRAVVSSQGARFLSFARTVSKTMHTDPRFVNLAKPEGTPNAAK